MSYNNTPSDLHSKDFTARIVDALYDLEMNGFTVLAAQNAPRKAGFWMVLGHGTTDGFLTDAQIDKVADLIDPHGFDVDDWYQSRNYMGYTTLQCPCNLNP